jgi:hypothetical protein
MGTKRTFCAPTLVSANDAKRTAVAIVGLKPVSPKDVTCAPDLRCLETERFASAHLGQPFLILLRLAGKSPPYLYAKMH